MEHPLKNSSIESQNESVSLRTDREGVFNSTVVFPVKDFSPENKENSQSVFKNESNEEMNGYTDISCVTPTDNESVSLSELSKQKTYSPTLIESALKVMKNLFSPDKTKSKSTSLLNIRNEPKSDSPRNSICNPGKTDLFVLELENEILSNTQYASGENSCKSYFQNNELEMVQTPLTLDPLNNTDESFMTTVSLIDDSFHSAVTHLDEHGDFFKNGCNLKENILNNSRNLDLIDPYNDTLENNESCLENTTLKIDNVSSDANVANFSVQKDGVIENLNSTQTDGKNLNFDDSEKVSVIQVQQGSYSSQSEKVLEINAKVGATQNVLPEEKLKAIALPSDINTEAKSTVKSLEVADIFLNKSFSKLTPSKKSNRFKNDFDKDVPEETNENFDKIVMEIDKNENEIRVENSNYEGNCLGNSISTTTVVLDTAESTDLEKMLMSLKADDLGTNILPLTSTGSDDLIYALESMPESDTSCVIPSNLLLLTKQKRACFSEGNSPNRSESIKIKLNKSDELINRRVLNESFEKKLNSDKSSVDFSLMKYSEASKISKKSDNVKAFKNFKRPDGLEISKSKVEPQTPSNKTDTISQQSYTILTVHDKSLNRPVIEPINISTDLSEQQASQKDDSNEMASVESGAVGKCFMNNNSDGSLDSEDLVKPYQLKQSTPLWEGHNETGTKFLRPTALKLHSAEISEPFCEDIKMTGNLEECDLLSKKAKQIFPTNDSTAELSPVNLVDDPEILFRNSAENEVKINRTPGVKSQLNKPKKSPGDCSKTVAQKLNQTFDKANQSVRPKSQSAQDKSNTNSLNHTFEKIINSPGCNNTNHSPGEQYHTAGQNKLNVTFDVNTAPPNSNETFTKGTKVSEVGVANLTFDKPESPLFNKTYDKPFNNELNQTFSKSAGSPGPQKSKEYHIKKPESPLPGEVIQVSDRILESPTRNVSNQTFVKDLEKPEQESNQTFEIIFTKEPEICGGNLESASEVDSTMSEENKTSEKKAKEFDVSQKLVPNEVQLHSSSGFAAAETLHCGTNINTTFVTNNDANESFVSTKSSNTSLFCSDISTVVLNEEDIPGNKSIDNLSEKMGKIDLSENTKQVSELGLAPSVSLPEDASFLKETVEEQNVQMEEEKLRCDPDLLQLIREQFSSNDIEKICSVVQDLSSIKLSNEILKASEQFDKSFHGNSSEVEFKVPEVELNNDKTINALSPQSFDFLNSIGGKPTGRDLSRESLYVKFDPLVQPSANSLIDFTKEGEALSATDPSSPVNLHSSSICEQLLTISPQKKPDAIVPPLTPLSHKVKSDFNEEKLERLKELQNEIYFLKNLYAERERSNKSKMEDYENQITKLTGESCMLEDKLRESNEREKSLVKKMKEQTQSIGQLKIIMEEYVKVISKLSSELEAIKSENLRQLETLSLEKDSYMTHLQNTEAAFTDVHAKYEKSKKTIVNLKANEALYKKTITEQTQKMEEFKLRAKEAQEKALMGFQKIQEELNETKASHSQEAARLRAQLRKTELKVEALQESLDQKIKENQQLTAICDELIEGKK